MEETYAKWGWVGVLCFFILRDVWPFFRQSVFPRMTKKEDEARRIADDDRKWRRDLDERQMRILEKAVEALNGLILSSALQNQKLDQLYEAHARHDALTTAAIADMRESVAKAHQQIKEPVTTKRKVNTTL